MPDLLASIRATVVGAASVTSQLPAYSGSFPVFTRRPVPDDAPFPMIIINPQIQSGQADGMRDQKPVVSHDVIVYGRNGTAGTADHYRAVERVSHAVQQLFHRQRSTVSAPGWRTIDVTASGPAAAPADDEETVARRVEVMARMARLTA